MQASGGSGETDAALVAQVGSKRMGENKGGGRGRRGKREKGGGAVQASCGSGEPDAAVAAQVGSSIPLWVCALEGGHASGQGCDACAKPSQSPGGGAGGGAGGGGTPLLGGGGGCCPGSAGGWGLLQHRMSFGQVGGSMPYLSCCMYLDRTVKIMNT